MSRGVWLRFSVVVMLLAAGGGASAATVQNVRAWSGPEGTRVVFELSGPVEHRVFALADPDRVVIDLPGRSAPSGLTLDEPKGAVTALRAGRAQAASCGSCSSSTRPPSRKRFCWRRTTSTGIGSSSTCRRRKPLRSCGARRSRRPIAAATSSSSSMPATAARTPARAAAAARARRTSCSRSRARARGRGRRPARHARRARARRRLLRLASQAHGDRARGARRFLHFDSRRFVSRSDGEGRDGLRALGQRRERRSRVAARATRERVRLDRRRLAGRQRSDARARVARPVAERGVERQHGGRPAPDPAHVGRDGDAAA